MKHAVVPGYIWMREDHALVATVAVAYQKAIPESQIRDMLHEAVSLRFPMADLDLLTSFVEATESATFEIMEDDERGTQIGVILRA